MLYRSTSGAIRRLETDQGKPICPACGSWGRTLEDGDDLECRDCGRHIEAVHVCGECDNNEVPIDGAICGECLPQQVQAVMSYLPSRAERGVA